MCGCGYARTVAPACSSARRPPQPSGPCSRSAAPARAAAPRRCAPVLRAPPWRALPTRGARHEQGPRRVAAARRGACTVRRAAAAPQHQRIGAYRRVRNRMHACVRARARAHQRRRRGKWPNCTCAHRAESSERSTRALLAVACWRATSAGAAAPRSHARSGMAARMLAAAVVTPQGGGECAPGRRAARTRRGNRSAPAARGVFRRARCRRGAEKAVAAMRRQLRTATSFCDRTCTRGGQQSSETSAGRGRQLEVDAFPRGMGRARVQAHRHQ